MRSWAGSVLFALATAQLLVDFSRKPHFGECMFQTRAKRLNTVQGVKDLQFPNFWTLDFAINSALPVFARVPQLNMEKGSLVLPGSVATGTVAVAKRA